MHLQKSDQKEGVAIEKEGRGITPVVLPQNKDDGELCQGREGERRAVVRVVGARGEAEAQGHPASVEASGKNVTSEVWRAGTEYTTQSLESVVWAGGGKPLFELIFSRRLLDVFVSSE